MDLTPDRFPIVGVLLNESNENFMREWPGLPKLWIGTDGDVLFHYAGVEFDFGSSQSRDFLVMTEQRSRDAQQVGLQVQLGCARRVLCFLIRALRSLHTLAGQLYVHAALASRHRVDSLQFNDDVPLTSLGSSRSGRRPRSGVSIFCKPPIKMFVSRLRSDSSLICPSFVTTCSRRNSFSFSRSLT
jgi:hypothetical protein